MFKRIVLAAIAATTLAMATVVPSFAWADRVTGDPNVTADSPTGYFAWRDENGFHLRAHGPGDDHKFTGRLHTDGIFRDVETVRLESRDSIAVLDGGRTIVYSFHTYDAIDGLNFRIAGGTYLRLNLRLDGDLIDPSHIYLGATGKHPSRNPVTLKR